MVFLQTLLRVGGVLHRVNAHLTLVAAQALKTDNAVLQRIQSIILALAHVQAGMRCRGRYGWNPYLSYARTAEDSVST